jgi:hypothetical protein
MNTIASTDKRIDRPRATFEALTSDDARRAVNMGRTTPNDVSRQIREATEKLKRGGWPRKNARVIPDVIAGVKSIKVIAADHNVSVEYVYAAIIEAGYGKHYINEDEWQMVLAVRKEQRRVAA